MPSNDLAMILELAQRRVRTVEGEKQFNKPIGSPIEMGDGGDTAQNAPVQGQTRPVTMVYLRSLMTQFAAAKNTGNRGIMQDLQKEFITALRQFRQENPGANALKQLTMVRGNQAQAAKP